MGSSYFDLHMNALTLNSAPSLIPFKSHSLNTLYINLFIYLLTYYVHYSPVYNMLFCPVYIGLP